MVFLYDGLSVALLGSYHLEYSGTVVYLLYMFDGKTYEMSFGDCVWDVSRINVWDCISLKTEELKS